MSYSGDAAEQIVKLSLEGVEVAAKITGGAAKEIALLIVAALKSDGKSSLKLKGRARLASMLKSGKPLEIFSVKESDLDKFRQGAKEYGIVYCVLRNTKNKPDGLCDILVKADDAPKISRLIERFKFATVDRGKIESEIVAERSAKAGAAPEAPAEAGRTGSAELEAPDIGDTEKLLDDLLGTPEGKADHNIPEAEKAESSKTEAAKPARDIPGRDTDSHPFTETTPQATLPSEPTSGSRKKPERATSSKPSVKDEMREIAASRKSKGPDAPAIDERAAAGKAKPTPATTTHKQPQRGKPKNQKGSR